MGNQQPSPKEDFSKFSMDAVQRPDGGWLNNF